MCSEPLRNRVKSAQRCLECPFLEKGTVKNKKGPEIQYSFPIELSKIFGNVFNFLQKELLWPNTKTNTQHAHTKRKH